MKYSHFKAPGTKEFFVALNCTGARLEYFCERLAEEKADGAPVSEKKLYLACGFKAPFTQGCDLRATFERPEKLSEHSVVGQTQKVLFL